VQFVLASAKPIEEFPRRTTFHVIKDEMHK
jgi:hypothetical protein